VANDETDTPLSLVLYFLVLDMYMNKGIKGAKLIRMREKPSTGVSQFRSVHLLTNILQRRFNLPSTVYVETEMFRYKYHRSSDLTFSLRVTLTST
jgi:hypothetical protein